MEEEKKKSVKESVCEPVAGRDGLGRMALSDKSRNRRKRFLPSFFYLYPSIDSSREASRYRTLFCSFNIFLVYESEENTGPNPQTETKRVLEMFVGQSAGRSVIFIKLMTCFCCFHLNGHPENIRRTSGLFVKHLELPLCVKSAKEINLFVKHWVLHNRNIF